MNVLMTAEVVQPMNERPEYLPTRSSLIRRVKELDDSDGWKEFFDTYRRSIHGLAMRCGLSRTEAEEVVQETMVMVAKAMPSFNYDRSLGSFKGWLFTITRRTVSRQFGKREHDSARQGDNGSLLEDMPQQAGGFEAQWEEDWRNNMLDLAIDRVRRRVKPKQFQMFDLYVTQNLPMEQVTQILNVNAAQVYMAKLRISSAIRQEVSQLEKHLL
jgi:RNA polymerase sigma factor (sigma-70 family)